MVHPSHHGFDLLRHLELIEVSLRRPQSELQIGSERQRAIRVVALPTREPTTGGVSARRRHFARVA
jgi:hypothetical protein